ncbi:MAG: S-methyl-5-thioribose-1-phosphate isomerase, partial [Candidatus Binatia bacterium]
SIASGDAIPIEERSTVEVTNMHGVATAPVGTEAANPAFDVTPARYVTAIVTERGVARPPYEKSIPALVRDKVEARG